MSAVRSLIACSISLLMLAPGIVFAQEVCFVEARQAFEGWRAENGKTLDDLSAKFEASADPFTELVDYNGMQMPIAAALIIEGEKYGRLADAKLNETVTAAETCSNQTRMERGLYDFAREILLVDTILPERATRIDFEELRRGNILGGKDSFINEAGRTIDETFNPFRW